MTQFHRRTALINIGPGHYHPGHTGSHGALHNVIYIIPEGAAGQIDADINKLCHLRYHSNSQRLSHFLYHCMSASSTCIVCTTPAAASQATAIANIAGLSLLNCKNSEYDLQLCYEDDAVTLYDTELDTSITVDFSAGALAHRQQYGGGRGQALARAVGLKHGRTPSVLDVTAGLARDAYILASLGCKITLVEQSPVLYALVEDGIRRGLADAASAQVLRNFMNLVHADAVLYMEHMDKETRPEVIYIDPMYPERKKSALVKKDMQILQRLLGKPDNAVKLLETALACAGSRVVVKRPLHAGPVGDIKPDTSISSKKTRYDIYFCHEPTPAS